jgi:hypothetical protein
MSDSKITRERVDELLRFRPLLGHSGPEIEPEWQGGEPVNEEGVRSFPVASYPETVYEFFELASQEWWCDYGYDPERSAELIRSDAAIARASLDQLKSLLTYCVRGERFCEGHWGTMVREGRVGALLRRLAELRDGAPEA